MKDVLQALLEQLKSVGPATKAILVLGILLVAAVVGFAAYNAATPHFRLLYSGLDAQQAAAVQAALAGGNVRFEVSQPPAPFIVHVDEAQYYQAQNLVALAGALERAPEGIQANQGGAKDVFLSAGERAQNTLKREWQELEKQLEELDFVQRARVSTSLPQGSVLRPGAPMTVAVTLQVAGGVPLARAQAATVARLVRYRFNVPQENVMIADQSGRSLWDGGAQSDLAAAANDLLEHKTRFDEELAARTNAVLDRVFGAGLSYVVLNSDWNHARTESIKETVDPANKAVVSKTEKKSSVPSGESGQAGGAVGTASNVTADQLAAGTGGANTPSTPPQPATTSESRQTTLVGKETSHRTDDAPTLERLTVSLFLDESLQGQKAELEQAVKTAIGFVDQRDALSSLVTAFATLTRDEQGKLVAPAQPEPLEGPSPLFEMLLQRGVEIAAAIVFLLVMLKALKSAPKLATAARVADEPEPELEQIRDPKTIEILRRRQVEELVKSDPDRISAILSRWANEEDLVTKA